MTEQIMFHTNKVRVLGFIFFDDNISMIEFQSRRQQQIGVTFRGLEVIHIYSFLLDARPIILRRLEHISKHQGSRSLLLASPKRTLWELRQRKFFLRNTIGYDTFTQKQYYAYQTIS